MIERRSPTTKEIISDVRELARRHGYAVAVHGSQKTDRDLDLVAIPWTRRAHAASTLRRALDAEIDYLHLPWPQGDGDKPHGRQAWVYLVKWRDRRRCPRYVDLSVMPRQK